MLSVAKSSSSRVGGKWYVVGLLWIAYLMNYIDRQVVFSVFPILRSELHFSDAQLGLIGTIFLWVYSLCMPFTGRVSDIFRRDRVIVASIALWSIATLGTGFSHSVGAFLGWRAVVGVTESMYVPAALGLIAGLHPGATRSRAIAIHMSAQYAGLVAGGWYGGWMADHIGWRLGFGSLAALGLVYAALLWILLKDARAGVQQDRPVTPFRVLSSRCYLTLNLSFFCFCVMLWMLYAWLPSIIYERFHLSMTESGLTATLYLQSSSVAGVLIGGTLADHWVRRTAAARFYLLGAGLLLCSPFAYLTFASPSLGIVKLSAMLFGLTAGLFMGNHFAAAYDVTERENYGFAAGFLNMAGGTAGGAGVLAAGLWKASLGIDTLALWAAGATMASAALMLFIAARYFRAEHSAK